MQHTRELEKAYLRVRRTVSLLAAKVEEYPSTPYTKRDADDLVAACRCLRLLGDEIRAWHRHDAAP